MQLQFYSDSFTSIATQATLLAGLSFSMLVSYEFAVPDGGWLPAEYARMLDLPHDPEDRGPRVWTWPTWLRVLLVVLCVLSTVACVLTQLLLVQNAILVEVNGLGLALRGPDGSAQRALMHMRREIRRTQRDMHRGFSLLGISIVLFLLHEFALVISIPSTLTAMGMLVRGKQRHYKTRQDFYLPSLERDSGDFDRGASMRFHRVSASFRMLRTRSRRGWRHIMEGLETGPPATGRLAKLKQVLRRSRVCAWRTVKCCFGCHSESPERAADPVSGFLGRKSMAEESCTQYGPQLTSEEVASLIRQHQEAVAVRRRDDSARRIQRRVRQSRRLRAQRTASLDSTYSITSRLSVNTSDADASRRISLPTPSTAGSAVRPFPFGLAPGLTSPDVRAASDGGCVQGWPLLDAITRFFADATVTDAGGGGLVGSSGGAAHGGALGQLSAFSPGVADAGTYAYARGAGRSGALAGMRPRNGAGADRAPTPRTPGTCRATWSPAV